MSDLTLLTEDQCWGPSKLDIFKKRGAQAVITDFSILLGGGVSNNYVHNDNALENRTGYYWTRTEDGTNDMRIVGASGYLRNFWAGARSYGARPVLPFTSADSIPSNEEVAKKAEDGILEVEYGYYPQRAVSKDMQGILEKIYKSGNISTTGNSYTTDSTPVNEYDTPFQRQTYQEYEHNGKRYVRVKANFATDRSVRPKLSNGEQYKDGDYVWVEVSPVKWLVDEKEKVMITDKIIFAGVQFNDMHKYDTKHFDNTEMKKFLDEFFSRDLMQSRDIGEQTKNPYNLDFSEASEKGTIPEVLQANVPIFLHGKYGCGKSDRVRQLDPDFIELNLSHLNPELLYGPTGKDDEKAVAIKPAWLNELEIECEEEPDKPHILFLEELTNASPMIQEKAYKIALDRTVAGRWSLPENARVVVAGDEREDSSATSSIPEPIYDRFAHINIETNTENWLKWAMTHKIHPAVIAYISYKGDEALRTSYNGKHQKPYADPRRWEMASDMLYETNNPNTLKAIIGEDVARDFTYFCKQPTITIDDVLKGNYTQQKIGEMDLGRKLATVSGLVSVGSENMPQVREFVKKLGPELCKTFDTLWAVGNEERLEQLQEIIMQEQEKNDEELSR